MAALNCQSAFRHYLRGCMQNGRRPLRCMSVQASSTGLTRKVKVAHIQLQADEAGKALASSIRQQLADGGDFAALAQEHSTCASKQRGGLLGWLSPGTYIPAFEEAALPAPVGSVVEATTPRGLHLIQVQEEAFEAQIQQMSPQELADYLSNPGLSEDVQFVDVREPDEHRISRLPLFQLYPLSTAAEWSPTIDQTLDPKKQTVVLCHHGVRSMQASQFLVSKGFTDVWNITGGIHAYSQGVDSSVPMY
jgi:rhodanese-related sulfurtransferase